MKKKTRTAIIKITGLVLLAGLMILLFRPTFTPRIKTKNGISELKKVLINDEELEVMIRGCDKDNPVIIFVHGGPCCSEIPYVRKYQKEWEKEFTLVHYDQRGSGKSYAFGSDYRDVTATVHKEDLIAFTEYIENRLNKEKVILIGHSYGTYIALQAAAERPDLYSAYIGIGQMSDTIASELDTLDRCIAAAQEEGNTKDEEALEAARESIEKGESLTSRSYVRKYGFGARLIDDNADYLKAFFFSPEYNLLDGIRMYTASIKYQDELIKEALEKPINEIVSDIDMPVYFVMGSYDGMTSPKTAKDYLESMGGEGEREFVTFEESAHYPQFEEKDRFGEWLKETFIFE